MSRPRWRRCSAGNLCWLCRYWGAPGRGRYADARYTELYAELVAATQADGTGTFDRCWGIHLAYSGFQAAGTDVLERFGPLPLEHRLMALPIAPVRTAATDTPWPSASCGFSPTMRPATPTGVC